MTILQIKAWIKQIRFILQQDKRKATSQEEHEGEARRPTNWLLQLRWSLQWLRRGIRFFKLVEPSPSSDSHEQGGLPSSYQVTVALITDCPTIMVHTGKCYKDLIDSGAAISLMRYSIYQTTESSFKIPIQSTTTMLNTADRSPMTPLEMMALQLRKEDFKFTHNIIIYDRQPDTEVLFGIDIQKKIFPVICLWQGKELLHTGGLQISHLHQKLWTKGND